MANLTRDHVLQALRALSEADRTYVLHSWRAPYQRPGRQARGQRCRRQQALWKRLLMG